MKRIRDHPNEISQRQPPHPHPLLKVNKDANVLHGNNGINTKMNNAYLSVNVLKQNEIQMHRSKTFTLLEHLKLTERNNLVDLSGCLNGSIQY